MYYLAMALESLIDHSVEEITSKHLYVDYVWITVHYTLRELFMSNKVVSKCLFTLKI